jgi:hypothetical protein
MKTMSQRITRERRTMGRKKKHILLTRFVIFLSFFLLERFLFSGSKTIWRWKDFICCEYL